MPSDKLTANAACRNHNFRIPIIRVPRFIGSDEIKKQSQFWKKSNIILYINNKIYFQLFSKDTATAFFAKLCYNWKQSLGAGACADRRPSDGRRSARVARAIYPGGKHSLCGHVLTDKPAFGVACRTGKFCRPAIRVLRAEPKVSASPCLCPWQSRQSTTCASMCSLANWPATLRAELAGSAVLAIGYPVQASTNYASMCLLTS